MNYRSTILFGTGRGITDDGDKLQVLEIISEHLFPGRWKETRQPTQKELDITSVVAVDIEEVSVKIRTGPPINNKDDHDLHIWTGVLPFRMLAGTPEPDQGLDEEVEIPSYLRYFGYR